MKSVCQILHGSDPYAGFDADKFLVDIEGWNSNHPIFSELIQKIKPKRVVEVGTWKGASAIHMAQLTKQYNIDSEIICVDTFLGWPGAEMQIKNGFPLLYWQFITNVVKRGYSDIITPFPQTSELAAMFFQNNKLKADLVYIDGSHCFGAVYDDLVRWWPVVNSGGYLFGDDYLRGDVRRAVTLFADLNRMDLRVSEEKWAIVKVENVSPVKAQEFLEKHKDIL